MLSIFKKLKECQYEAGKVRNEETMLLYKIGEAGRGQIMWDNADTEKKKVDFILNANEDF